MRIFPLLVLCAIVLAAGCFSTIPDAATSKPRNIPSLAAEPVLDGIIKPGEWEGSLLFESEVTIDDGTMMAGTYPLVVQIAASETRLLVAVQLSNISDNPTRRDGGGYAPDGLFVLLNPDDSNQLGPMSDFRRLQHFWVANGSVRSNGHWTGTEWAKSPGGGSGLVGRATNTTFVPGRLTWEAGIPRDALGRDGEFALLPGTAFRLSVVFERQGVRSPDAGAVFIAPHDSWPGEGYTPYGHLEPAHWLRLRIP